jgi:tRNA threonylcarbamoyladenosine biosynthesis protein TsaE
MEEVGDTTLRFEVTSPAGLSVVADELLRFCGHRRIVAFFGEMGAGKTTFIRELCGRMGVRENVSSPTFSLINEYRTERGEPVYHFDFYRLNRPEEALSIGVEEYFTSGALCLVEWPEKILNLLPDDRVDVTIVVEGHHRIITFAYA